MGFYIRKALLTGPIRVNLSKGGLGFSAGVTGARVGVNRQGVYVHGGRGGLYYRKYMKKGAASGTGIGESGGVVDAGQTVTHFQDTGATLARPLDVDRGLSVGGTTGSGGSGVRDGRGNRTTRAGIKPTSLQQEDPLLNRRNLIVVASSFVALLLSLIIGLRIAVILTSAIFFGLLGYGLLQYYWRTKTAKRFHMLTSLLEKEFRFPPPGEFSDTLGENSVLPAKAPALWRYLLAFRLHAVGSEMAMRNERIHVQDTLAWLDKHVPLSGNTVSEIRISILSELLQEMLEDHLLGEEENDAMNQLIEESGVSREKLRPLLRTMDAYNSLRAEIQRPLLETSAGIPLLRGEVAYESFDHVRILKERVFDRFQRDRVQHRVVGYEIRSEGRLVITDRRMVLVGRGSREYRLNQLLDITVDPEAGVIELTMNKRKSPIILTTENLMLLSARLERVHQMVIDRSAA